MLKKLKQHWREFREGRPGHRFQDRHERNREDRSSGSTWSRFLKPFAAILLIGAGVVFCAIPGPGLPLLLIGAGLLADVSLLVARALDWTEAQIRAVLSPLHRWWSGASATAKSIVVILMLLLASGAAYGVFRVVTGGGLTL
ncbi:MAG: hypothetical protein V4819_03575 [Verrucomicrobiota bacterium]